MKISAFSVGVCFAGVIIMTADRNWIGLVLYLICFVVNVLTTLDD